MFLTEIANFTDKNQLGLAGEVGDFVVVSVTNRRTVSIDEQQLLKDWLASRPEVILVRTNDGDGYIDAWIEQLLQWGKLQTDTFIEFFS